MSDATVIVASLSDKEMRESIDALVNYVGNKTSEMATKFDAAILKMRDAMKDFAVTQQVSVSLMQQAWQNMSASFDAMIQAQQQMTRPSSSSTIIDPNIVGGLKSIIQQEEQRRNQMQLHTNELRVQNSIIAGQKELLKEQLMTTEERTRAIQRQNEALERQKAKELKKQQAPMLSEFNAANTMSAKDLTLAEAKLKRLQDIQQQMRASGLFDEAKLNRVQKAIDQLQSKIEKMKSKRPKTLKEVLGMDESSVDAVAKKMAALKKVQLAPNDAAGVKAVGDEYQRLSRLQSQMLGRNIQQTHSNNMLAQSFGYIRNRIVYALTLGALTSFTKQIYEIRGQYELLERSLGVLVGSFQRGSQIFNELNEMAIRSPFTLIELGTAAKQLTAYNFAADEVVNTTRRLADISAALGVPMERLTYNLGQIRAQTVLTARDARDFANAGLPIVKNLADYYSVLEGRVVSTGDVYDRMSKKMVSYNDVMTVLNQLTDEGGKFFDFQAKQADTLRVQINNLTLAWNNMLNELGSANQGLLTLPVTAIKTLLQNWKSLDNLIWDVISAYGIYKTLSVVYAIHANKIGVVAKNMKGLYVGGQNIIDTFKKVGTSIGEAFTNKANWITLLAVAVLDLGWSVWEAHKAMVALNEEIRKTASESFESFDKFAQTYNSVRKALDAPNDSGNALNVEQTEKAWKAMREEIQNSSAASDNFIVKLESINDISDRLRAGFNYIDRMKEVDGYLKELDKDAISVHQDWSKWWNLWLAPEGLKNNIDDYIQAVSEGATSTSAAYQTMLWDVRSTVKDMVEHFQLFDPEQQRYAFEKTMKAIAQREKMGVDEYRIMRMTAEDVYAEYATGRAKEEFATRKSEQEIFFRWLNERHSSELHARLGNMSKQELAQGEWLVGENAEWAKKMTQQFTTQYGLRFDDLYSYVRKANTWSIYIPVVLGNEDEKKKSIYEQLTEADSNLDTANKKRERLQKRINQLEKDGKTNTEEYKDAQEELTKATKDYNDALAKGAQLKTKGGGGAKKDPLGDALTKEIQLVSEIQKRYNDYRKAGVDATTALTQATNDFSRSLALNNAQLAKFGIAGLSADKLATMDLRDVRNYYQGLLDTATKLGNTKGIEALDKAIAHLNVEIANIDYKRITSGLNSELSKLKDEYELAVELDANPELGNMFTEMFGLDTTNFPRTIDEYMRRVQAEFDDARKKLKYDVPINIFKASDEQWVKWGEDVGIVTEQIDELGNKIKDTSALEKFRSFFTPMIGVAKKWAQETIKSTQDLEYKLGDLGKKIEIENKKLKNLEDQAASETNVAQKHLLELQIEQQMEAIEKLKSESIKLLPFYVDLFGDMYNVSVRRLEEIANAAREVMTLLPEGSEGVGYTQRTDKKTGKVVFDVFAKDTEGNIKRTTISLEEFIKINKQIDSIQEKIIKSNPWKKIKDSFSETENGKVKNFAEGLIMVSDELAKIGDLVGVIGNISETLGLDESATEVINDVSNSIGGLADAGKGVAQIYNGDVIGGIVNVTKGLWQSISTWFDNSDKRITRKVEESKREVARLENAYAKLEWEATRAMGSAEMGAQHAIIANRQLQLVEIERQLELEKSRKKKNQDADLIIQLEGQYEEAQRRLVEAQEAIANNLLGDELKSAAESFVDAWVEAWKAGEATLDAINEKVDDMVNNLIKKAIASTLVSNWLKPLYDMVDEASKDNIVSESEIAAIVNLARTLGINIDNTLTTLFGRLEAVGVVAKSASDAEDKLSGLQQGIQSVTEETAGAIEAYMNGISQQVYLQSTLLTQIKDTLAGFDFDVQSGTLSQMLLQLQNSYQVQESIRALLEGWNNPSGQAVRVELV